MFTSAFPIISTPDLGRALAFYRDGFGGRETYRFPPGGDPATDQPWGERVARVHDPDGNLVLIGSPPAA
jgi:uncharacterized glyoxalase superfamily protein PhnB